MSSSQPFLHAARQHRNSRLPAVTFDPKSITRASWEPKPKKPRPNGPLISFNRHPDAHLLFQYQSSQHTPLRRSSKAWIKWLRRVQLLIRLLQLSGAIGVIILFSLFKNVAEATSWAIRIMQAVTILHCAYALYHLSRDVTGRTPASSAAYQFSAVVVDVASTTIYIFATWTVHRQSDNWDTLINNQLLMVYFIPAVFYIMIGTGALHIVSATLSFWLGWMFQKITHLPPDMNPLEDNLTARPFHQRNESSFSDASTVLGTDQTPCTPVKAKNSSIATGDNFSSPSKVSFMRTRNQSQNLVATEEDPTFNLPNHDYQRMASNQVQNFRSLGKEHRSPQILDQHSPYEEIPVEGPQLLPEQSPSRSLNEVCESKFIETWLPTEPLIPRTNQRNKFMSPETYSHQKQSLKTYAGLTQQDTLYEHNSDSEYEEEDRLNQYPLDDNWTTRSHPNPLASNPMSSTEEVAYKSIGSGSHHSGDGSDIHSHRTLLESNHDSQRFSTSQDVTDERLHLDVIEPRWKRGSSIQLDDLFYSKPYGEMKPATPPILVGSNRKLSSGNDFASRYSVGHYGRRNVSGKIAEEGRADNRFLTSPMR